ncbi:hypothetical protein EJ08DRAFT_663474 [Tothia fuscella]|uniref:Uncharacterized protein n=1 Tax=Tothia fuscella TaxID=1048955 RepID=A0A9P4NLD8_9PEZI|nr:hypothetical protein EJ08DRAFT_663474 [Tothia fuscella]
MSEALAAVQRLQALAEDVHWFCPRVGKDDNEYYFEEDVVGGEPLDEKQEADRKRKVDKAQHRKEMVLAALPIFAFDGADALTYQQWMKQRLADLMGRCDVCARKFHTARRELKHELEQVYDEEDVIAFMDKFDNINITRINDNLAYATKELLKLPPEQRRITQLNLRSIYGIFEVLSCEPYFLNEQLLTEHFDQPFQLVQTKKKLRLTNYIPALTVFLFSKNQFRHDWAMSMWAKIARPPTALEFDVGVRPYLLEAMKKVHMTSLQVNFLPFFWNGTKMIISHLDKELITHALRSMDVDIYKLALGHFHLNDLDIDTLVDLLATFRNLLETSPTDFWDAMKSISAATVMEQVFNSPALDRVLMRNGEEGIPSFKEIFNWVNPFMDSIKLRNQTPACRSLVNQLIARSHNAKYPADTRSSCLTLALRVLLHTLDNLNQGNRSSTFVGAASVAEMLELVNQYIDTILSRTRGAKNSEPYSVDTGLALEVIEQSLRLDSLTLVMDWETVKRQMEREKANDIKSESLWNSIARNIKPGNQALATHALLGAQKLLAVEQFGPKFTSVSPKDPELFNAAYDAKWGFVCNILERLASFSPFELAGLFKTPQTAAGVVATLLSPHNATRQAAHEMLEQLSGQTTRRDTIGHVLGSAYLSSLSAINAYIVQVTQKRIFSPVSSMIKLCMDVVDVLTNTQDGILRARDLDEDEVKQTEGFWKAIWQALVTIFNTTERWSTSGHDKNVMMDFCRDVMQFAESLFDGYSVFVSTIRTEFADAEETRQRAIQLLRMPRDTMNSMVKWLRLRDEYLADKIVKVVSNLLIKLRKANIDAQKETLDAIESVTNQTTKTKLNFSQINELVQALEKHTGKAIAPATKAERKASKQSSISGWATPGKAEDSSDQSDFDKKTLADATRTQERFKKQQELRRQQVAAAAAARRPNNVIDQEAFKAKRLREQEEKKRRDAVAIARAQAIRGEHADLVLSGSAVKNMGVLGKDHAAKGTGMMVSSGEDTDSDDDDDDDDLFGEKKLKHERNKAVRNGLLRKDGISMTAVEPKIRGPLKIKRMVRSFKDMRARLAPDLSSLHKEMLGWNYFHDGDFPPGSRSDQYSAVPNVFRDPVHYANIFRQLLILEAWQGLVKAREENSARPYDVRVVTRSTVDSFVEVSTTLTHQENIEISISEGDIVVMSKANNPAIAADQPHCLARVAKVSRKKQGLEILYRVVPGNKFISSLNPAGAVRGIKVQSMTTLEREYGALVGLKFYDLCDHILKAEPSPLLGYNDRQLEPFINTYKLNKAQAKAVKSAIDNDAFTLIQGPPGSGKTKTIVAIVGALLTDSLRDNGTAISTPKAANAQQPQTIPTSKKLLVCAPSNAAVDELVMRFKDGITTKSGQSRKINIVRLGRADAVNTNVKDVVLEELVNARMSGKPGERDTSREETQKLMMEHKAVSEKLRDVREKLDSDKVKGDEQAKIKDEFDGLRRRKTQLGNMVDHAMEKEKTQSRTADLERKRAQQEVLDQAHVICATLSGSGHDMFQNLNIEFETVVVDEAAQCVETSALIPLKYGCAKCILVGDPKQLPPTVFSREAARFQYEQSLFVRMQTNHPKDVHLLDTQYRMHPEISSFPSATFYDGRLLDGPNMAALRQKPWHSQMLLSPYRFFDVQGQHSAAPKGHSLVNHAEIKVAMELFEKLSAACPSSFDLKGKIGIITPYKSQLRELKDQFKRRYGDSIMDHIEFNTTDAFQGRESEVIIFSCVRASPAGGIGFLQDIRRMNVGLTRAKSSLWVLGNSESLMRGEFWRKLVEDAKRRNMHSPAGMISALNGSHTAVKMTPVTPVAPAVAPAIKREKDNDVIMSNGSRKSSVASSTGKSSIDTGTPTTATNSKPPTPTYTIPAASVKEEIIKRKFAEIEDVEMKDILNVEMPVPPKEEEDAAPPKQEPATGGNPGFLMSRPAGAQPIIKRKKVASNALLMPKKPKRPK